MKYKFPYLMLSLFLFCCCTLSLAYLRYLLVLTQIFSPTYSVCTKGVPSSFQTVVYRNKTQPVLTVIKCILTSWVLKWHEISTVSPISIQSLWVSSRNDVWNTIYDQFRTLTFFKIIIYAAFEITKLGSWSLNYVFPHFVTTQLKLV